VRDVCSGADGLLIEFHFAGVDVDNSEVSLDGCGGAGRALRVAHFEVSAKQLVFLEMRVGGRREFNAFADKR
jgi:hypothetical protein